MRRVLCKHKEESLQRKVQRLSEELTELIRQWLGVTAIVLGEAAEIETLDPYFSITLDVYFTGNLPPANDRRSRFGNPTAFEAAPVFPEDRFLREDLPVRIRYHETGRFELILKRIKEGSWVSHASGTRPLYRLAHGQVLVQTTPWLDTIKKQLQALPERFWTQVQQSGRSNIGYYLNDLRAAVHRGDALFYTLSLAAFLREVCSFLFAFNRVFEPSGRMLFERVRALPQLPDGFHGRFESLLRDDPELPPERKGEIAGLLGRSLIAMA